MKLFLHIGTEKTGSTLLQEWLYENKSQLSQVGIYLSDRLGRPSNRLLTSYFQSDLDEWAMRNGIADQIQKRVYFEGFLDGIHDEIAQARVHHHSFIITSEHLHSRLRIMEDIQKLHQFLAHAFDEIKVIAYFRDQFDMAMSRYSTLVKGKSTDGLATYIEKIEPEDPYFNHLAMAHQWSSTFGRHHCVFKRYDRRCFVENDLRKDFLSSVYGPIDFRTLNMSKESSNEALFALQAAAYRIINEKVPYWRSDQLGVNAANVAAKTKVQAMDALKIGKLTSQQAPAVRAKFAASNQEFFKQYFNADVPSSRDDPVDVNPISLDEAKKAIEAAMKLGPDLNVDESLGASSGRHAADRSEVLAESVFRLQEGQPLFLEDVVALMEIVLEGEPNDPLVRQKVAEWKKKLKTGNGNSGV